MPIVCGQDEGENGNSVRQDLMVDGLGRWFCGG